MQLVPLILRAIQFILTLLITALIGNAIAISIGGSPSSINYAMFAAVFSWIVLFYGLAALFIEAIAIPMVLLAMDGLAVLFTFIAGVVLAAKLHVHSCGNDYYLATNSIIRGSTHRGRRCHELQASTAFFWFLFATYIGTLVLIGFSSRSTTRSSGRSAPAMSQV